MKTIILLSCLLALTTTGFTQVSKGQFLIGGNMNLESTKNNNTRNGDYKTTDYFISPDIGYFIIDKMAIGLRTDFRSYKSTSETSVTHQVITTFSPFLRYYFLPVQKKVNAFIDAGYIHEKSKWRRYSGSPYVEKAKGYFFSGGPSIFITDQIALEFTLGYKHTKSNNFGETKVNKFSSGFGLQIHLEKIRIKQKAQK